MYVCVCLATIYFVRALSCIEVSASVVDVVYYLHTRCIRSAGVYLTSDLVRELSLLRLAINLCPIARAITAVSAALARISDIARR